MQANDRRDGRRSSREPSGCSCFGFGADASVVLLLRRQIEREEHVCAYVRIIPLLRKSAVMC